MSAQVKLKTDKDLADFFTGIFQPHVDALQGIMDKLPEAMRPDFKKLYDDLNGQLKKLAPTDQVPAALDASYALQSFCNAMERMQEYAMQATQRLATMAQDITAKTTALQGWEKKVTDGLLLTKEAATELCGLARKETSDAFKPQLLAMRKQQVELAKLPMPTDELLGLDDKEFTPLFEAAKLNVKALADKGCTLAGRGAGIVKELAWAKTEEFNGRLKNFEDVLGTGTERRPEPLLGGGGGGEAKQGKDANARANMW